MGVELLVPRTLGLPSLLAFEAELERARAHDVVVLVGEPQSFSTGLDFAALCERDEDEREQTVYALARCLMRVRRLPRPTIALVEGEAKGAGVGIAAACDVVLATPTATFGLPEARVGLRPALIEPLLRERMHAAKVRQLVLRGSTLVAFVAVDLGIADRIVEPSVIPRVLRRESRSLARARASVVAPTKSAPGLADAIAEGAADTLARLRDPEVREAIRRSLRSNPRQASA